MNPVEDMKELENEMNQREAFSALRDAVAILDYIDRNAEAIRGALLKAGMPTNYPDLGYEARAKRIRQVFKDADWDDRPSRME